MPRGARRTTLNPFGFLTGSNAPWPDSQLKNTLRLKNNSDIFKRLKTTILRLVKKHMDIDYPPSQQNNRLNVIRAELKAIYPDIFAKEESEKRLYFASRVIYHAHTTRRYRHRQQQLRDATTPSSASRMRRSRVASVVRPPSESIQEVEPGSENDDDNRDHQETPPPSVSRIYSRPNKQPIVLLDAAPSPSNNDDRESHERPPRPNKRDATPRSKNHDDRDFHERPPRPNKQPIVLLDATPRSKNHDDRDSHERPPRPNKRSIDATPSPSNNTMSPQYRPIYDFLEASKPPMTHLMDSFIKFGCINLEFLRVISSWSSEKIRDVLDQLPPAPGSDGRKITQMEKFILENHFKDYFA